MKRVNFNLLICLFLMIWLLGNVAEGQNIPANGIRSLFITGITYDSKTLEPLSNTNFKINNLNSFSSNESGRFSFFGSPRDTIVFTYMGYQPTRLIIPDTLRSEEYVVGVFLREQPIKLAEIIILPRMASTSIMITPVKTDQKTMDIAQSHANDAVVKGLTQTTKVYDADMNAKKAIRTNQMRTEYKGMLVTPENTVGFSTQNIRINSIIYGSPISTPHKVDKEMVTNNENLILISQFEAQKRLMLHAPPVLEDTTKTR